MLRKEILIIGSDYMASEIEAYKLYLESMLDGVDLHHVREPLIVNPMGSAEYIVACYKAMSLANVLIIFTEDGYQDPIMNYMTAYAKTLVGGTLDPMLLFIPGRESYDRISKPAV